ncbi:MAG: LCP family protein [bacterium]
MREIKLDEYKPTIDRKKKSKEVPSFKRNITPDFKSISGNEINKIKKKKGKKKWIFLLIFIIMIGGIYLYFSGTIGALTKSFDLNPIPALVNTLTGKKNELNSTDGRTNILILGVDNRANTLTNDLKQVGNTDSIMVISYDSKNDNVEFISIPRDIGLNFTFPDGTKTDFEKINAAVNIGANKNYPGGGAQLLRDTINKMTGLQIHYTAIINFDAFRQVIDSVGGIDIEVENSFCDAGYPIEGDKGVETIKFYKGLQHMDGGTALKFARSRVHNVCYSMTSGDPIFEGTDFRRAYRQQQVIKAIQEKVINEGLDVNKIQNIIQAVGNNMLTQIGDGELSSSNKVNLETLLAAYDLKNKVSKDKQYSLVTSFTACGGNAMKEYNESDGYYILPMKNNDFTLLQNCINFYLNNPKVITENAKINIYNTGRGYTKTSSFSEEIGASYWVKTTFSGTIFVKEITDPNSKDIGTGNYIVDLTGNKTATVEFLKEKINAQVLNKEDLPSNIEPPYGSDILILAGAEKTSVN